MTAWLGNGIMRSTMDASIGVVRSTVMRHLAPHPCPREDSCPGIPGPEPPWPGEVATSARLPVKDKPVSGRQHQQCE